MTKLSRWPLDKVLNLLAGTVVLTSLALARRGSPRWRLLTGFVGSNLLLSGAVGWCPSSLLLHRAGLRSRFELMEMGALAATNPARPAQ
jgi:hypothetical protein